MIKIFYKNNFLLLSDKKSDEKLCTKINFLIKEDAKNAVNVFLSSDDSICLNIYGLSEHEIWVFIRETFTFIKAAGGIISDESDRVLFIKRLGYFDLPKGKVEKGEEIMHASIREVCEECGIVETELTDIVFYDCTYHIYPYQKTFALKETSWFLMNYKGNYNLSPQLEENITEIFWLQKDKIDNVINQTYPSLVELLTTFINLR